MKNFNGGEIATITIYEIDPDNTEEVVDIVTVSLNDGTGHYTTEWTRSTSDACRDLQLDNPDAGHGPLCYRFDVTVDGVSSPNRSSPLYLTKTLTIDVTDEKGNLIHDEVNVILTDPKGTKCVRTTSDGSATFEDVILGNINIEIEDLDHRILEI